MQSGLLNHNNNPSMYIEGVILFTIFLVNELLGQFGHSDGGTGFDVGQGVADH